MATRAFTFVTRFVERLTKALARLIDRLVDLARDGGERDVDRAGMLPWILKPRSDVVAPGGGDDVRDGDLPRRGEVFEIPSL